MSGLIGLFLAAFLAPDSGALRDLSDRVFPPGTSTIFTAEVAEAVPSAWRTLPSGLQERTIRVRLTTVRVLVGAGAGTSQSGLAGAVEIRQRRWSPRVVWDVPGFWSHRDPRPGRKYLVFSSLASSPEAAFAEPLGVWDLSEEPSLLQDVELVLAGKALGQDAQESQVLGAAASSVTGSVFFARYAATVAALSKSTNRKPLLAWVGRAGEGALSEGAKAELLRAFHSELTQTQGPPGDALKALAGACLRTLAALPSESGPVTPRVESIVQVYLPWLARAGVNLKNEGRETLTRKERVRAAAAAGWLASLDRFPEGSRSILRGLAEALK